MNLELSFQIYVVIISNIIFNNNKHFWKYEKFLDLKHYIRRPSSGPQHTSFAPKFYMKCHQGLDMGGKPLGTWKLELDIWNDTWNSTINFKIRKLQLSLTHINYLKFWRLEDFHLMLGEHVERLLEILWYLIQLKIGVTCTWDLEDP